MLARSVRRSPVGGATTTMSKPAVAAGCRPSGLAPEASPGVPAHPARTAVRIDLAAIRIIPPVGLCFMFFYPIYQDLRLFMIWLRFLGCMFCFFQ